MAKKETETAKTVETTQTVETADVQTENSTVEEKMEELVEYTAPVILGKTDQAIFVSVNGENIRIQRGETVKIKRKFKEVLDHAAAQEMAAYRYMQQAQQGSAKALAELG